MDTGAIPFTVGYTSLQIVTELFGGNRSHIYTGRPSPALRLSRHNLLLDNIKVPRISQAPDTRYALPRSRRRVMFGYAYQGASRPRTGPSPPE